MKIELKNKKRESPINKIFTIIITLFPILQIYEFSNSRILVADVILAIILLFFFFKIIKRGYVIKDSIYFLLVPALIYIVFQWLILMTFKDSSYISLLNARTAHNIFYLIIVIFFAKEYFDINIAFKTLRFTAIFSTIYIIVQLVLVETIGYYLPGTLPFFDTIADEFNTGIMSSGLTVRPRSIFSEPSGYATFISVFLMIELFKNNKSKIRELIPSIFVSIGLIIARSSTGYLLGVGIWGLWAIKNTTGRIGKKKFELMLITYIILPIIGYLVITSDSFQIFIEHTTGIGGFNGRVMNYMKAFNIEGLSLFEILIGRGMIPPSYYIPGIPRLFFYFGYLGSFIWITTYFIISIESNRMQRLILLLMIINSFFGDTLFGINYLVYFPFIIKLTSNYDEKIGFIE